MTLREIGADLRFEAPAAHGCRMVIAAIDALAHLNIGRASSRSRMSELGEINSAKRSERPQSTGCSMSSANAAAPRSGR
jgi:hypothetical protein